MEKSLNCTEAANILGISKAQVSYWINSKKLAKFKDHIQKKGRTKLIDIFLLEKLFKLAKREMPEYLKQELNIAIADQEMDKVIAGKNLEVELEIYKTHAAALQDELDNLKYDLIAANDQIKSLELLLNEYYNKVGKVLDRNIELLEKLEPLVKLMPADTKLSTMKLDELESFVEKNKKEPEQA